MEGIQNSGLTVDVNEIIDELTNENAQMRKQLALSRAQVRALNQKVAALEQGKVAEVVEMVPGPPPGAKPVRNKRAAARKRA